MEAVFLPEIFGIFSDDFRLVPNGKHRIGVSRSRSVPKNGNARWVPVPRNGNAKRVRVLRNGNAGWVPVPKNGERITTLYKMTKICISIPIYTYELQENAI